MKLISVPLTREAMHRLNYNQCIPGDLEELELDDEVYREIWSTNFFDIINKELDTNIDDYEDEIEFASKNWIKMIKNSEG